MDQRFRLAFCDVGFGAVIFNQDLQRAAADAAALVDALFGEQDAVAFRTAQTGTGTGER